MAFYPIELDKEEILEGIERLTNFCSQHSWEVRYSDKARSQYYNKVITLSVKHRLEVLYYIFMHEIGHAWMYELDYTYRDRYPELARSPRRLTTVTYKIAKVQEEIEAWEVGKNLARNMGLRINLGKFEKIRAYCLSSYMEWASRPRRSRRKNGTKTETETRTKTRNDMENSGKETISR